MGMRARCLVSHCWMAGGWAVPLVPLGAHIVFKRLFSPLLLNSSSQHYVSVHVCGPCLPFFGKWIPDLFLLGFSRELGAPGRVELNASEGLGKLLPYKLLPVPEIFLEMGCAVTTGTYRSPCGSCLLPPPFPCNILLATWANTVAFQEWLLVQSVLASSWAAVRSQDLLYW